MLCYWGAKVREGFGLIQSDKVKHLNNGIRCVCPTSEIQDVSVGRNFVGFIRNGKVSVTRLCGDDHDGKLKQLETENQEITLIDCGGDDPLLLAHGGKVIILDESANCRPLKDLAHRHVIQISCGDQHSMALTQEGQVFVWGKNSHGQLGLGEGRSGSQTPQHVQCLDGVPLAQISAGGDHSFVLSLSGVVFGWGKNSSGQLGLGDTTDRCVPTLVKSLNRKKTQFISCGGEHTATLSKGGTVFTFGAGVFGQLGHNTFKDEHLPRVVAELWGSEVSQVTCGRHHTLVLVGSSKRIYSFGCGTQGQLGNGQMTNQSVPSPVHLPAEFNDEFVFGTLIAGEHHSFALFFKELGHISAKPEPNPNRGILTLDDRMIDQRGSECNNKINQVFSSAACLNGSFLKTSCDEHYQTSANVCGMDFDLVKKSFAKLSENKNVMTKITRMVRDKLLPSLNPKEGFSSVEALRVYLLLPELIRVYQEQHRVHLLEALASKILQLKPDALEVLENYWFELPEDRLKDLVKLFRNTSAMLIDEISSGEMNCDEMIHLKKLMQVLQMIYKVCCRTHNDITSRDFIIHKINDLLDMLQATLADFESCLILDIDEILKRKDHFVKTIEMLVSFPFVAETVSKWRIFKCLRDPFIRKTIPDQHDAVWICTGCTLHINRISILKDTLQYLRKGNHSFQHLLKVKFAGEDGIDAGALSAEFFSLLSQSFLTWKKKPLTVWENSLVWFNAEKTHNEEFYYLGLVCGMALFNQYHMSIDFPLALFKKLLDQSVNLNDIEEMSPVEARGLKDLLQEDEEVVDALFQNFTFKGQELIPNGAQIPVTTINRQKYVDLYVDFIFNKSVKNQFEPFSAGFSEGCPVKAWKMFHPEELREVFYGSPKYEWEDLQKCATYEHCSPSDELIKNFWTVFFELSEENKNKFLIFMYGTGRVPPGGLSKRTLKIVPMNNPDSDDLLPVAQTCFGTLYLPKYSHVNKLRHKLIHAISFCEVFGQA
ncbi:putative E3 ubiquitin-protein ligase HERC3 [Triplophysa tibetana]|uniref:Putative E3 ubiquitin-protein ligase HERC3 n=1 Tax=Triplophysa tibetana TaxID=1572043 RepID=A0A5A9PLD9_9TELE|nr:putative E3 ubiquitin-protein ligase HERC3 [Triplophysa tibetana]